MNDTANRRRAVIIRLTQELEERETKLVEALRDLTKAEAEYRKRHDLHGDNARETGYAWDKMRQAGDRARALIEPDPNAPTRQTMLSEEDPTT